MIPTVRIECKHEIIDGCFDDLLCAKRIKMLSVDGVIRPYNLGCIGKSCPNFTPKTENVKIVTEI